MFLTIEHVSRITDFCSCIYVLGYRLSLIRLCDIDFGITPLDDITIGITCAAFCFHMAHIPLLLLLLLLLLLRILLQFQFAQYHFVEQNYAYFSAIRKCHLVPQIPVKSYTKKTSSSGSPS